MISRKRARFGIVGVAATTLCCHDCCFVCLANFHENPVFPGGPANDSPRRRSVSAMSKLLRLNPSPSYFPLPQNGHVDDDKDPGKETVQYSCGQRQCHLWLPWLQLAIVVVLLFLAGIAGFFIGLSHPESRWASSSLPDTVPRGSLCSRTSRMRPADR